MPYIIDTKYNDIGQSHWYKNLCKEFYKWRRSPVDGFDNFMTEIYPDIGFTAYESRFVFHFESEEVFTMYCLKWSG